MPITDLYVVMNPVAGRGRVLRAWPRIRAALKDSGMRWEMGRTERHGHAAVLAEQAARDGWSAVVAVGGDGTVHEVANGLLRAACEKQATVPMGVVGEGSGNDFVKMIGEGPGRPVRSIEHILAAEPRQVDVGFVRHWDADRGEGRQWYFTNGVGLGFDARVAVEAAKVRRLRGMAVYAWGLVKTLRDLRTPRVEITLDGEPLGEQPLLLTTVGNGACHGGSFWLCPQASVDDGLFDVLVVDGLALPQVVGLLPKVMRGTHLGHPAVRVHQARQVRIRSDEPLPIHADGEIVAAGVREIEMEIVPRRLTIL